MRRCPRAVVNWGRGDGRRRERLLARLERKRNPEPLAERRRDEIDLGEAGPAEKPVAADARTARDADGRQKEVGNAPQHRRGGAGPFRRDCGSFSRLSRPSSASPVGMAAMIGPDAPRHKALR